MVFFHSGSASVFGSRAGAPAAPGRDPFRAAAVCMLERGLETRLLLAGSGVMRCSGHLLFVFVSPTAASLAYPSPGTTAESVMCIEPVRIAACGVCRRRKPN
jgi:hypothetical protein